MKTAHELALEYMARIEKDLIEELQRENGRLRGEVYELKAEIARRDEEAKKWWHEL